MPVCTPDEWLDAQAAYLYLTATGAITPYSPRHAGGPDPIDDDTPRARHDWNPWYAPRPDHGVVGLPRRSPSEAGTPTGSRRPGSPQHKRSSSASSAISAVNSPGTPLQAQLITRYGILFPPRTLLCANCLDLSYGEAKRRK